MYNDLNLNDIQVFVQVVQQGSFVGASRSLGIPRSTISRRVSELERRLGARLLHRTTRSLRLTEVGETYYQYAEGIISQVEEANLAVSRLQAVPRGVLRVTSPMNFGNLGSAVASYLERCPEVRVEVVSTDRIVDLIVERFDVAIRAGRLADSSMVARKIGTLRNVLVASPEFLEKNGTPEVPSQLEELDCLVFAAGSANQTWTLQGERHTLEIEVNPRLRANDMDVLRRATIAGLGIASIPTLFCSGDIRDGALERVLPGWCSPEVHIHALYPSARLLSPKLKIFLEHLREHLRDDAP